MLRQALTCACMALAAAVILTAQTLTPKSVIPSGPPSGSASPAVISVHNSVPVSASVTLALINPDGTEQDQQGSYFRSSDGKIREDSPAGSVITDFKAGTITTLNPATMQAVVSSTPGPKSRYVQTSAPPVAPTMTSLGPTTVEGHPVVKRLITSAASPGQSTEIWTATDIRMTVLLKVTSPSGQTITRQYQNIQMAEPDPGLFAIPQGYTIVAQSPRSISTSTSVPH